MIHCPRCGGESPQGSAHCVHCGQKLGEADSQQTQFGMPQLSPLAGPANPLASVPSPLLSGSPLGGGSEPTPVSSLLAGLPRPRVASAPSPLTTGGSPIDEPIALAAERESTPSARSTVMGMPIMARPSTNPMPMSVQVSEPAAPAATLAGGIQSMDDLDFDAPAAPADEAPEPSAEGPAPAAIDDAPASARPAVEPAIEVPAKRATPPAAAGSARAGQYALPDEAPEPGKGGAVLKVVVALVVLGAAGWFAWTQFG